MRYHKLQKCSSLKCYTFFNFMVSRVRNSGAGYLGPLLRVSQACTEHGLAGLPSHLLFAVLFQAQELSAEFSLCNCRTKVNAFFLASGRESLSVSGGCPSVPAMGPSNTSLHLQSQKGSPSLIVSHQGRSVLFSKGLT